MKARTAFVTTLVLALGAAAAPSVGHAEIAAQADANGIELRGARSMIPLAQHLAEAYMTAHPEATIVVGGGSAHRGLKSLLVGTAEMAMATGDMPEWLQKYRDKEKIDVDKAVVYFDAVAPIVNPKNPVQNLSLGQLRDVFRGKITNWKEVGGSDAAIVLTSHFSTSGSFETLKKQVLGEDAVVSPSARSVSNAEMLKIVGADEKAIGYTNAHDVVGKPIKALTVDGIPASAETVQNQTYPIRREMCIWWRKPISPMVDTMRKAFLSPEAKDFVRKLGDVPAP